MREEKPEVHGDAGARLWIAPWITILSVNKLGDYAGVNV
jgi:hypothetical protein